MQILSAAQNVKNIADDAAFLAKEAEAIRAEGRKLISGVIAIGGRLAKVKARVGHGRYLRWLHDEFEWSESTALRYVQAFEAFGSNPSRVTDLDLPLRSFYRLVAPSTPESARTEVIERAEAGERLKHAEVQEIIEAQRGGIVTGVAMRPHADRGLDLYETPEPAVRALLLVEWFSGPIWEPACGPGAIVRVLRNTGHKVIATDIKDDAYGCPDSTGGMDFLKQTSAPVGVTTILTNPPFMHANEFVRHALTLAPRVVMLLRLAFLEGQGRSDILDGGQLARVCVFRNRLQGMHRDGWEGPLVSTAMAFAWFCWDREHRGPTELHRISWEPSAAAASDDGLDIPHFLPRRAAP